MRRTFAALLLILLVPLLAACGDDDGSDKSVTEPEPELVQTLVLTSAGGKVAPQAYFVDERDQMKAYVKTFDDRDDVAEAVKQAVTDAGDREGSLAVATIAIGCDVPSDVSIVEGDDGWEVIPGKVKEPQRECFAPTTSIAVVEIP
jgi:hypothetical protein